MSLLMARFALVTVFLQHEVGSDQSERNALLAPQEQHIIFFFENQSYFQKQAYKHFLGT